MNFDKAISAAVKAHLKKEALPENRWYSPHLFLHNEKPNKDCYYCKRKPRRGKNGR